MEKIRREQSKSVRIFWKLGSVDQTWKRGRVKKLGEIAPVRLVEDDDLVFPRRQCHLLLRKHLNLVPYHIDPPATTHQNSTLQHEQMWGSRVKGLEFKVWGIRIQR